MMALCSETTVGELKTVGKSKKSFSMAFRNAFRGFREQGGAGCGGGFGCVNGSSCRFRPTQLGVHYEIAIDDGILLYTATIVGTGECACV